MSQQDKIISNQNLNVITLDRSGDSVSKQLQQVAEKADTQLFGILDAARSDTLLQKLSYNEQKFESLYKGTRDEKRFDCSPFLVEYKPDTQLYDWFDSFAWGNSYGIFIVSSVSFDELAAHLKRFLYVVTENEKKLYFRFYDPRVLRVYLPTCTDKELTHLYGPIDSLIVESLTGESAYICRRQNPKKSGIKFWNKPTDSLGRLVIREPQMKTFSRAMMDSFRVRMISYLKSNYPDKTEQYDDESLGLLVDEGIKNARSYGIKTESNVQRYLVCMVDVRPDFDRHTDTAWAGKILNSNDLNGTKKMDRIDNHLLFTQDS